MMKVAKKNRAERVPVFSLMLSFLLASNLTASAQSATPQQDPANSSSRLGPPTVDLTAADQLAIRFRGYDELTGDYRVSADNMISVPVIGRVSVAGMTAVELEKSLSKQIREIAGKDGFVTVEVAAYRSVFVTGFVNKPGAIQWQPRLTVLQAISMTGGIYRPDSTEIGGGIRKAVDDQKRVLARLARLRAEKVGSSTIEIPRRLVALVGRPEAEDLIERQEELLVSRRTSLESQLDALERGKKLAEQELVSLRAQSAKLNEQLRARQDYRDKLLELQKKGTVSVVRGLEEDLRVSDIEEKITNIAVGVARVQSTITEMNRDGLLLKTTREAEINTEIARLERDSSQLDIDIDNVSAAIDGGRPEGGDARYSSYQIIRQGMESSAPIAGSPSTLLKPGDVVVVSQ